MNPGWRRLGRRIAAERARKGFRTAAELADVAGLSDRTVEIIESGAHSGTPRPTTLARIEQALGWADGSCLRIVEGGRATNVPDAVLARVLAAWPHLTGEQRIKIARLAERYREHR